MNQVPAAARARSSNTIPAGGRVGGVHALAKFRHSHLHASSRGGALRNGPALLMAGCRRGVDDAFPAAQPGRRPALWLCSAPPARRRLVRAPKPSRRRRLAGLDRAAGGGNVHGEDVDRHLLLDDEAARHNYPGLLLDRQARMPRAYARPSGPSVGRAWPGQFCRANSIFSPTFWTALGETLPNFGARFRKAQPCGI